MASTPPHHRPHDRRHRATVRRARGWLPPELTEADRAAITAEILARPPLTDDQIDALCDLILAARARWRDRAHRSTTSTSAGNSHNEQTRSDRAGTTDTA